MGTNRSKRSAKKTIPGPDSAGGVRQKSKARTQNLFAGRKSGRNGETAYHPEFAHRAKLLRQKGATMHHLAIEFGVPPSTILQWQVFHEEFAAACKIDPDAFTTRIEESIAERAIGYVYMAEEPRVVRGRLTTVRYRKHVPADVSAAKYWLELRGTKLAQPNGITPEAAVSAAMKRLYDSICGTKLMPNEDQTAWLERGDYPGQRKNNAGEQPKAIDPEDPNED